MNNRLKIKRKKLYYKNVDSEWKLLKKPIYLRKGAIYGVVEPFDKKAIVILQDAKTQETIMLREYLKLQVTNEILYKTQ